MTRLFRLITASAALVAGLGFSASAQEAPADPNARTPVIVQVGVAGDDGQQVNAQYVGGDGGWANVLNVLGQMRSGENDADPALTARLWEQRNAAPPIFLFEYARRTVATDPDTAIYAFLLGRTRTGYDVRRCLDSSAEQYYPIAAALAGQEVTAAIQSDIPRLVTQMQRVLAAQDIFDHTASPWWICSSSDSAYIAATNSATLSGAEWLKVESRWAPLREEQRERMEIELQVLQDALAQAAAEQ
jgi:hypothetical protein